MVKWSLGGFLLLPAALGLLSAARATPIGVVHSGPQASYLSLTANVLSAGRPSEWFRQVLNRETLSKQGASGSWSRGAVARSVPGSRTAGSPDPRFAPFGGQEHGAGRCIAVGGNEAHRPQDRGHLPPVRHRQSGRPRRGRAASRRHPEPGWPDSD